MNLNYVGSVAERFMKFRSALASTEEIDENLFNALSIYIPKSLATAQFESGAYDGSKVTADKFAVITVTVDNYANVLKNTGALYAQWLPIFNDGTNLAVTLYCIVFDDTSFSPTLGAGAISWSPLTKAFKELYSRVATGSTDTAAAEKELFQAFEQTRRLYALMALLPVALQTMAQDKILKQKRKFNPDIEIINECSKFASNPFSVLLKADSAFMNWCNNHAVSWSEFETSLKDIYARICSREYFKEYIALDNPQMGDALKLFHRIYSEELDDNTVLEDALENSNIWWLEDLEYVLLMLLNNLPAIAERQQVEIPAPTVNV